jgi:hypothetical protein
MFYCESCAKKNGWPWDWYLSPASRGPCEVCGKVSVCADVHHSFLKPVDKVADSTEGGEGS